MKYMTNNNIKFINEKEKQLDKYNKLLDENKESFKKNLKLYIERILS